MDDSGLGASFRVSGLGFRVSGFRVQGFWVSGCISQFYVLHAKLKAWDGLGCFLGVRGMAEPELGADAAC